MELALVLLLATGVAAAEPEVADEAVAVEPAPAEDGATPAPEELDVPSALDGFLSSDAPGRRIVRFDAEGGRATSSWILLPQLGNSWLVVPGPEKDYRPTWLGAVAGRRWYRLGGNPGYAVEATVSAMFPFGPRVHGRQLRASVLGGPRVGPFGLVAGPVLLANEVRFEGSGLRLPEAALAGGRLGVVLAAGAFSVSVGVEPVWRVAGEREATDWSTAPAPGFGDELSWFGGLVVPLGGHLCAQVGDTVWLSSIGLTQDLVFGVTLR